MNSFEDLWRESLREWFAPDGLRELVLYHYTTASGLLGILQSGGLRGSNARFLNDASEVSYGYALCSAVIEEELASRESETEVMLLSKLAAWIADEIAPSDVYVTSFTELPDDLAQWRGYGSRAGRFCIGFRAAQFSERNILQFPQRVEYDVDRQRARVRGLLERGCAIVRAKSDQRTIESTVAEMSIFLGRLIALFKHPAFAAEREWRSIDVVREAFDLRRVEFEIVAGVPRPHVTMLEGSRTSRLLPIIEVRVGDLSNNQRNVLAVRLLLDRFGYGNARVNKTEVPFSE